MSMNVKKIKSESKFERPPALEAGTYPGRVVQIISLGLQAQRAYKGEDKPPKIDLYMTYELSDEFMQDENGNDIEDKPRWTSETFPLNSLETDLAKSTKRYYALDPEVKHGGEFGALVSTPCMITLSHEPKKGDPDTVYNNIQGVSSMRAKDAAKLPELVNTPKVFDFYEPDLDVFLSLPQWLQDKIKDSLDYGGSDLEALVNGDESQPKGKEEDEGDDSDW